VVSTDKRAADPRRVRDEALLDRRYFSLDPERWAAFQAALDAPARPNPRMKKLSVKHHQAVLKHIIFQSVQRFTLSRYSSV
jgi:hypothetical protein